MASSWLKSSVLTDRLALRPLKEDDQPALIALFTDPEVRRFVGGPMTPEAAKSATAVRGERWGHFMICDRPTDSVIGTVSFARNDEDWELSFQLARTHWGQGLATEAVRAALGWFFAESEVPVVTAFTQVANQPSIQLLDRLGGAIIEKAMYRGRPQLKFAITREGARRDSLEGGVIIGCGNVIEHDGSYLLVNESKQSARSRFNLPAGKPEVGESLPEAAAREAEEESGLKVRVDHLIGVYHCIRTSEGFGVVNFVFASTVVGGEIRTSNAHPEVGFFTRDQIRELGRRRLLRGTHIELALDAHTRGEQMPVDLVRVVPASPLPGHPS